MSNVPWLSHLALGLILFLSLPVPQSLGPGRRLLWLLALVCIGFVPIAGLGIAAYWHSLIDELAITTVLWMAWAAWYRLGNRVMDPRGHWQRVVFFGCVGLPFYAATLGLSAWDPYSLGFVPWWPLLLFGLASVAFCLLGNTLGCGLLLLATIAYWFDLKASGNYWDYVLDPLLVLYCIAALSRRAWQRARRKPMNAEAHHQG